MEDYLQNLPDNTVSVNLNNYGIIELPDLTRFTHLKESIKTFILNNELKIDELSKYLLNTQNDKNYMLYKNGSLYLQSINSDNYRIISYKKEPELKRYTAITNTGINLNILLRWKNGNGIAYPAFQISYYK